MNRFVQLLLGNLLAKEKHGNTEPKAKQKCMHCIFFSSSSFSFLFFCLKCMTVSYRRRMEGLCMKTSMCVEHVFMSWWTTSVPAMIEISDCFILVGTFDWFPLLSNDFCRYNYSKRAVE